MYKRQEHNIVIRHNGKVSIQGNCNFGFLYGMMAKTFVQYAKNYGLDLTQEDSEKIRADFFNAYPTLLTWHEECKDYARTCLLYTSIRLWVFCDSYRLYDYGNQPS